MITHKFEGLTNGETYYAKVFTANPNGRVNNREDVPAVSCVPSSFPGEPTEYALTDTITTSTTFTAPAAGYYRFDVWGASGKGGTASSTASYYTGLYTCATGGGGGSGGFSSSVVKLKKGETVVITVGVVGSATICTFNSSMEKYDQITITSGSNGGNGYTTKETSSTSGKYVAGSGGSGGVASGGNITNTNGNSGKSGTGKYTGNSELTFDGGAGGTAVNGGNAGGAGGYIRGVNYKPVAYAPGSGKSGFIKIYAGNTNAA